jgi:hypothetical protein
MTSETYWMIFSFGSGAAVAIFKLWQRDKVTDKRVDLMWRAHLARGQQEGLDKGMIQRVKKDESMASHLCLDAETRAAYKPIAPALKAIYAKDPRPAKFAEAVEEEYGAWLSRFICGPLGVNQFACLSMALIVAKESEAAMAVSGEAYGGELHA